MLMSGETLTPGNYNFNASNGIAFTYTIRGKECHSTNQQQLLLIQCPGWGIGSRYLQVGLSPLETDFTVIYFTPRGSPGSSRPHDENEMTCFDMAEDLELFRKYLKLDRYPAMLGHSHGGTIVLAYAERFPNRVERVILIDHRLLGYDDPKVFEDFKKERKGDARYDPAYKLAEKGAPTDDKTLTRFVRQAAPIYFYDPDRYVPEFLDAMGDGLVPFWCLNKIHRCNKDPGVTSTMRQGLGYVRAAVLLIFGKQDAQCTVGNATETKSGIPQANVTLIDECGHYPWIEKPEETFMAIKRFLLNY